MTVKPTLTTVLLMTTTLPTRSSNPTTESDEYGKFVRRIMRAYGRRVADLDIEGLSGLAQLQTELTAEINRSAKTLHEQGYSWSEIGRVLGTTKQAAQQRFGR